MRSLATVSDAQPAPDQRDLLAVLEFRIFGRRALMSSLLSAATRFSDRWRPVFLSTRPRRHAGSQGRSQTRAEDAGEHVRNAIPPCKRREAA